MNSTTTMKKCPEFCSRSWKFTLFLVSVATCIKEAFPNHLRSLRITDYRCKKIAFDSNHAPYGADIGTTLVEAGVC